MCVFTVARITKSLLLMMMVTMMRIWKVSVVSKIVLGEVIFNILSTLLIEKKFFFFNRHHFFSGWHICTRTVIDLFVFSRLCLYLDLMDLNKMRIFILEPYKQARLLSMVHFTLIHSKNISFHSVLNKSPDTIVIKTRVFFHFKNDRATREEAMQRKKNMNIQQQHRTSNEKR